MIYWHVLFITILGGDLDGTQSYLIYPSYEACFAAHQIVTNTLPYDHKAECVASETPSGSIRPKRRP
jgi:hypothetical protein